MCDCLKANMGGLSYVFIAFAQSEWSPLPVSVCSLPLLCSLSKDWGEPVAPCDEGLLRDAAAVHEPGERRHTEVTGCWRGSVTQNSHLSLHTHSVRMIQLTLWVQCIHAVKDKAGVFYIAPFSSSFPTSLPCSLHKHFDSLTKWVTLWIDFGLFMTIIKI